MEGTRGTRRGVYFIALLLTALTMGLEFSHVLEWPAKQRYSGHLYVYLQESLYAWFGTVGGATYLLAIAASVILLVLLRKEGSVRWLVGAAAALEILALISFFSLIYPVNLKLPLHQGTVPPNWTSLRFRWELGHTVGFVLFVAAFILQLLSVLRFRYNKLAS